MVVALPWYDFPAVADRWDHLWRGLRRHLLQHGLEPPEALVRGVCPYSLLRNPALVLSQVCGYVTGGIGGDLVHVVATPDYDLSPRRLGKGAIPCPPGDYYSLVVVNRDSPARQLRDLRGAHVAANEVLSHSGLNALRPLVQPLAKNGMFFGSISFTGGHLASLAAVAEGRADVACVDAVTFALALAFEPQAVDAVRVVATTAPAPAPPLVTGGRATPAKLEALRRALDRWLADPSGAAARRELGWRGVTPPDLARYRTMAAGARSARDQGYLDFVFDEALPGPESTRTGGC